MHQKKNETLVNENLRLQEFCDMNQLYSLIDNWSKSSGMYAVIVDTDGNRTSESFGMTEFCKMIHNSEKGIECCESTWKEAHDGIYVCPLGFCDFSIPIALPDGKVLGNVLAGQVLSEGQREDEILRKTTELGIDENKVIDVLSRVHRKSEKEMHGSYQLLKEILSFFVEKNYSIWKANNEFKKGASKKDRVLSQLTQIMYSYNLTVNLETGRYTLITGTGMERTIEEYKKYTYYSELKAFQDSIIHPSYRARFDSLLNFDDAIINSKENGYRGTMEYPVLYPEDTVYEWHEINVFIDTEEDGTRVANMLGRDITEAHNAQEKNEKELQAAAAKNQILSEITRMLYSYNLTLNLRSGKYSMIIGNGMTKFMEIFKSTDDYETAYNQKTAYLNPDYIAQFAALTSLNSLRARTSANGFIGSLEYGAFTDGGEEWHEVNVFISTDEAGEPVANILGRDITEAHKRKEQKENQQKAAIARDQLLSGVTKMLYSYNLTVNLETWKYSIITGTGMNAVLDTMMQGDDFVLLYARLAQNIEPVDKEKLENLIGIKALQERKNNSGYAGSISCRAIIDNRVEWHEINLFIGTNEDGVPLANILGRDVTEAHELQEIKERELRATVARDQLLSGITKMLYSYNMTVNINTGKYTLITGTGLERSVEYLASNDSYEEVYQLFLNMSDITQRQRVAELLNLENYKGKSLNSGHVGTEEFMQHRSDRVEWQEVNVFVGYDENGETIINILGRDVTEAHEKADTKAQLEIANASSAAKSAFLFNMSHDIRTPMNAIIGFTELLEKHLTNEDLARKYIKKIQTSNDFLLSLINNVLEMAKIESGKTTLDETYWDAYEFNDSLYSLFDSQMKEKGIIFTRTSKVEHPKVICDETKLREIFLNILSNALKYTPSGGRVTMDLSEVPSDIPGYAMYKTVIEDTGIGMSEEFLPHLFEEFTRERSSTESRLNGTGLGMPIVKKLVDLMQGKIEVESKVGKGTRITVTLPHRIAGEEDAPNSNDKSFGYEEGIFKGKRILMAEDNELNSEIAITILEEAGFTVEHAKDGIICVDMMEKADAGYYDLILMDIQMPNMDGYKAAQTIRKLADPKKAGITIVAMTANAFEEDKRNAYKAGMNYHIAKPIKINELISALTAVFRNQD
ncbi:MAG: PocR ligand-binding domain-containing protein [Bacillota bacterium]|nr:PocR ligand-binding domain-containing protein [Bacillota bacterium]